MKFFFARNFYELKKIVLEFQLSDSAARTQIYQKVTAN